MRKTFEGDPVLATVTYREGGFTTAVYGWYLGADGYVWWGYVRKEDR